MTPGLQTAKPGMRIFKATADGSRYPWGEDPIGIATTMWHPAAMIGSTIPDDDPEREAVFARPNEDQSLTHLGVVGDTYTILLSGQDTAGRYCLIDMLIPPDGGPPPHRHDFEEMFTLLEGELEFIFRGAKSPLRAGETVNIPANATHLFRNLSKRPARLLCLCSPAGQEEFFKAVGIPLANRTTPSPKLDETAGAAFIRKAEKLAAKYRTELLPLPRATTVAWSDGSPPAR
jgi:quercetin dioxygenase-like cupin family protein